MAWSTLDLSKITDDLIGLLTAVLGVASPVWKENGGTIPRFDVTISGSMPESVRADGGCQLSLYLLHVSQDKFARNTPVGGGPGQLNRRQPLSLDLYYLLTAFAGKDYHQEQVSMGIALRCFHESTIVRPPNEEYTVTMEVQSPDETSRLWQALSTPLRLSVIYKVSIVFITPTETPTVPGPPPTEIGLAVSPAALPVVGTARVVAPSIRSAFTKLKGASPQDLDKVVGQVAPTVAVPGDTVLIGGLGLDAGGFDNVYGTPVGGAEQNVTGTWKQSSTASELRIRIMPDKGAVPTPGVYLITVGSDVPAKVRSNSTVLMIAARIDNVVDPPLLNPDGSGVYSIQGVGFVAGAVQVVLDTVPLTDAGGAPGDGQFQVAGGTSLLFKTPTLMEPGKYWVRIRVNGVESPPAWFIQK
jgi:hypothetical protein